mmetsp:Transcript_32882/g.51291  ORF Transcript_32882/g.51291 Transcript_32882/m.51291 type:complete len:114 (-) Transcript_32882:724-1065(-)
MDVDQVQVRLQQISDLTPELMGAIQTGAIETEDIFEGILMSFQTEPTEGSEERPDFTMTEPVQDIGLNFRGSCIKQHTLDLIPPPWTLDPDLRPQTLNLDLRLEVSQPLSLKP